jgi:hypothetical protein
MKNFRFIVLLLICLGLTTLSHAQQKTAGDIKRMVESKTFVFKAESASPVSSGTRLLSPGYDVRVSGESVRADLPFYGRAQTIPIGNDGGIRFNSSSFDYKVKATKKGWQVTVNLKDISHVQQLYFYIYDNGTATLDVMNIHRDNISFRGYISEER